MEIHTSLREKLYTFFIDRKIPHIVFHGSAGSGKKTLVHYFLQLIYGDKAKIKENVMYVNCAHGKGIKFIRDELKVFAKAKINTTNFSFKSIVLLNADFLTVEGQSALRRCIELFSNNTRFFIVVENKNKLLNPIISRFCEIYVPEFYHQGFTSIHQYLISQSLPMMEDRDRKRDKMRGIISPLSTTPAEWVQHASQMYENGLSALDLIDYIRETEQSEQIRTKTLLYFYIVRCEYRCEPLLIFAIFEKWYSLKTMPDNTMNNI
jgi:hypothetical protein